jgi:DNA anti-recombination protein RmuC
MEVALLVSASLSLLTSAIIFLYFRKMKEISRRYVEAKDIVGHVILSFKADLQKQGDRIRSVSQAVESLSSKTRGSKTFQEFRGELNGIRDGLSSASDSVVRLSAETHELTKRVEQLMSQQLEDEKKIALLESSRGKEAGVGERIRAAIPIRKDTALSGLTDTELRVLEILATEGEKTANKIREEIDLTREHTGRLMKSLYARGYAERRTDRLPYTYRIKGEMLSILKKSRTNSGPT